MNNPPEYLDRLSGSRTGRETSLSPAFDILWHRLLNPRRRPPIFWTPQHGVANSRNEPNFGNHGSFKPLGEKENRGARFQRARRRRARVQTRTLKRAPRIYGPTRSAGSCRWPVPTDCAGAQRLHIGLCEKEPDPVAPDFVTNFSSIPSAGFFVALARLFRLFGKSPPRGMARTCRFRVDANRAARRTSSAGERRPPKSVGRPDEESCVLLVPV